MDAQSSNASKNHVNRYTILIVDDNPTNLSVLSEYLEGYGFRILVAKSGQVALKRAEYVHPDIILLDIMMPGIDGFETCRRLKANETTKDIPVIFMTALSETADKLQGFELGAVDYITKPLHQAEMLARIRTHLNIQDLRRDLQTRNEQLQKLSGELKKANASLSKRAVQLETTSLLGQKVTSILDLDELLVALVNLIRSKFGYYCVSVSLLTKKENTIFLRASATRKGMHSLEQNLSLRVDSLSGGVASACKTKCPHLISNARLNEPYFGFETPPETLSEFTLPLQVGHRMLGVLNIHSDKPDAFDTEDKKALQMIANHIAIAIRNAQLYGMEKRLRRLEEEKTHDLAQINAGKDKFFSIVAHDLKGPFQPLLGMSNLLAEMPERFGTDDIRKVGSSLHRTTKNVYNLLENLLQWSRLQMKRMQYEPERLNLHEVIEDNVRLLRTNSKEKEVNLQNKINPELFIYADENMIDTIARNLISNAIKFTNEAGDVIISAKVKTKQGEKTGSQSHLAMSTGKLPVVQSFVEVSISDTGIGMSREDLNKLFRIDVHHSTIGTNKEQGTGLGLIICREMIEQNQGRIWIESKFGKGTTVKFMLPLHFV
ncbi:MAG: hypothetical protein B6242_04770 [Anaerolineaceae bacterium 4572_78]|nr:MAG: hypothetical protein B6242_04770 [Anaerolineaceae bacterium 4572_78]